MRRFFEICANVFTRKFSIYAYILLVLEFIAYLFGKISIVNMLSTVVVLLIYNFIIVLTVMFVERGR